MKIFLAIAAILAWLFGIMLLFMPAQFYQPAGIVMTPMLATVAQAHGANLFGLGVINWLARNSEKKGLIAVLAGNLVVQILSLIIVLKTMSMGAGVAVAPGIAIHVVLGSFFTYFLVKIRKMPS